MAKAFILACAAAALAACSSNSASGTSPGTDGGTSGGGDVCSAIAQADAQAIVSHPITSLQDFGSEGSCVFKYSGGSQGDSLQIDFYTSDADKTFYKTLSEGTGDGGDNGDHPLSGVGDEAYWNQAVPGISIPQISAHKGVVTCTIQPPDPPDSSCKTMSGGSPVGYTISESDGAAFAVLLGRVCNDVFAATH